MTKEVIGPGLINPLHTPSINLFVQMLFDILPLNLLIVACERHDLTISKFGALFLGMSLYQLRAAVLLCAISVSRDLDDNDRPELAM
jgi:hypothetical protein